MITIFIQPKSISTFLNFKIGWENLDSIDKKIIIALFFDGSPEEARINLTLPKNTFYRRWGYLKPIYNNIKKELPKQIMELLNKYLKTCRLN